jgi:hypothetical protein
LGLGQRLGVLHYLLVATDPNAALGEVFAGLGLAMLPSETQWHLVPGYTRILKAFLQEMRSTPVCHIGSRRKYYDFSF